MIGYYWENGRNDGVKEKHEWQEHRQEEISEKSSNS